MRARRVFRLKGASLAAGVFLLTPFNVAQPQLLLLNERTTLTVNVADSNAERVRGLSGQPSLPERHGLLFDFKRADKYGIWMRDMCFAIDIAWLDADGRVVDFRGNVHPDTFPESFRPQHPARYVVETAPGQGLEKGLKFSCAVRGPDGDLRRHDTCAAALDALHKSGKATAIAEAVGCAIAPRLQMRTQRMRVNGRDWPLELPGGCRVDALAAMDSPRMFIFTPQGEIVSGSSSGKVYRVPPPYTQAAVLGTVSGYPHSVALHRGRLLIARTMGLYATAWPTRKIVEGDLQLVAELPGGGGHTSRSVAVGPDNRVYLGLGITGNCSNEYLDSSYAFQDRRGGVAYLDKDGRWRPFASGLRNPVGFAWRPGARVMYATNNGPDHHGFEQPPERFSRLDKNSFHGMPWFYFDGERLHRDACIGVKPPRSDAVLPDVTFAARSAPMGVAFAPTTRWKAASKGDAVVAIHGSWATQPGGGFLGPKASRRPPALELVRFSKERAVRTEPLLGGLQNAEGERVMRPVGVQFGPDNALYFTSDGGAREGLFRMRCGAVVPAP